jgi:hypothetical protein
MSANITDPVRVELEGFLGKDFQLLSLEKKTNLAESYKKKKKTDFIILFWVFSFHYAYVGKWAMFLLFFLTLGGLGLWWVIDFFRLDTILLRYNKEIAKKLFDKL